MMFTMLFTISCLGLASVGRSMQGEIFKIPRVLMVCFVLTAALCVRFITKRFIGEYDHKKGKDILHLILLSRIEVAT